MCTCSGSTRLIGFAHSAAGTKANDTVAAVGVCSHCGVGLCLDHMIEASQFRVGGTLYNCGHELPAVKPLRGVPAGIAAAARHHSAGVS